MTKKQEETYITNHDGKEFKLFIRYNNLEADVAAMCEAAEKDQTAGLNEYNVRPDAIQLSIKTMDSERVLSMSGEEYAELRDLLNKDLGMKHRRMFVR